VKRLGFRVNGLRFRTSVHGLGSIQGERLRLQD